MYSKSCTYGGAAPNSFAKLFMVVAAISIHNPPLETHWVVVVD